MRFIFALAADEAFDQATPVHMTDHLGEIAVPVAAVLHKSLPATRAPRMQPILPQQSLRFFDAERRRLGAGGRQFDEAAFLAGFQD
ncbi:hypothetical protein QE408_000524 [Agrobacterium larrymoorei]|uniref:Uncharacterized protein n=1 Tax=Agrobacterium larrymoorei TaxID=160699 RepID=A0ABU0UEN5_9HYPH|nr:hypothetical protein [Agrobacterium larrymoorei]